MSLRSVEANFRDLGKVFVIGHKPEWLTGVVHIPVKDRLKHNKDANLIDKVLAVCERPELSDNFVRLSDDQLFWSPVRWRDVRPYWAGRLDRKPREFWGDGQWKKRLRRTYGLLLMREQTTYHYDSHCPMPYNKWQFFKVMNSVDYRAGRGFCINTLYFNSIGLAKHEKLAGRKASFESAMCPAEVRTKLKGKTYVGYNDKGLTEHLKAAIAARFPTPSRFEK